MASTHSSYGGSSAERWLNCPGSVDLIESLPSSEEGSQSAYTMEGSMAHELASFCLQNSDAISRIKIEDKSMMAYVREYCDYVLQEAKSQKVFVEQRVSWEHLIPEPGSGGTPDAVFSVGTEIHIVDLKYGRGVRVNAYWNPQLMLYAEGVRYANREEIMSMSEPVTFCLHIFQPRINNVSTWEFGLGELGTFRTRVRRAYWDGQRDKENRKLVAGLKQCRFCSAYRECPELRSYVEKNVNEIADRDGKPAKAWDEDTIKLLENRSLILTYLSRLEEDAIDYIMLGGRIQGYKLIEGRSNTRWSGKAEKVLSEMFDSDAFNMKLKAVSEFKGKLDDEVLKSLTFKPRGKAKLAQEHEGGKPYNTKVDKVHEEKK